MHGKCVVVRGQLAEVNSLVHPMDPKIELRSSGLVAISLSIEPFHRPKNQFFIILIYCGPKSIYYLINIIVYVLSLKRFCFVLVFWFSELAPWLTHFSCLSCILSLSELSCVPFCLEHPHLTFPPVQFFSCCAFSGAEQPMICRIPLPCAVFCKYQPLAASLFCLLFS